MSKSEMIMNEIVSLQEAINLELVSFDDVFAELKDYEGEMSEKEIIEDIIRVMKGRIKNLKFDVELEKRRLKVMCTVKDILIGKRIKNNEN